MIESFNAIFGHLIYALQNYPTFLYIVTAIYGLLVGSFLNVVIYRLPIMMENDWREQCAELNSTNSQTEQASAEAADQPTFNLVTPRSRCNNCGHQIKMIENIPVISYIVLRGACAACGSKISWQYPAIELLTAILSVLVVMQFGVTLTALAMLAVTYALIALSVIDAKTTYLFDNITLPFLWLGLLFSLTGHGIEPGQAIIGAAVGYLSLWSIYKLFKLITGKEGMGYGDFKLLAMLGAWTGWQALPGIILLSSFVGAVIGLGLIAFRGRDRQIPIPFGPYLAIAGWLYLLYDESLSGIMRALFSL